MENQQQHRVMSLEEILAAEGIREDNTGGRGSSSESGDTTIVCEDNGIAIGRSKIAAIAETVAGHDEAVREQQIEDLEVLGGIAAAMADNEEEEEEEDEAEGPRKKPRGEEVPRLLLGHLTPLIRAALAADSSSPGLAKWEGRCSELLLQTVMKHPLPRMNLLHMPLAEDVLSPRQMLDMLQDLVAMGMEQGKPRTSPITYNLLPLTSALRSVLKAFFLYASVTDLAEVYKSLPELSAFHLSYKDFVGYVNGIAVRRLRQAKKSPFFLKFCLLYLGGSMRHWPKM